VNLSRVNFPQTHVCGRGAIISNPISQNMKFLFPDQMHTHPLYSACRAKVIEVLKHHDELLGSGLLRLRWDDEDMETMVMTPHKTLRKGRGVEAGLWYCDQPSDGNYQPLLIQLLPYAGRPEVIDVVAYEGQTDTETPILVYDGRNNLELATSNYLKGFLARAKDAVEYRK
jgi:hypothetical protein